MALLCMAEHLGFKLAAKQPLNLLSSVLWKIIILNTLDGRNLK